MVLPTLIVGNELLILGGVGVAVGGFSHIGMGVCKASWTPTRMGWMTEWN